MSWLARLRSPRSETGDAPDHEPVATPHAIPISRVRPRELVTVSGAVVALSNPPEDAPASLTAQLHDGTGTLGLVFMGRREIPGIVPGRRLVAHGRAAEHAGRLVLYNPTYELLTGAGQ